MGLAEKKQIRFIEENNIPDIKKRLNNTLGKEIEININWDSFETVNQLQEIYHQALGRITEGIEKIASDDMGKEALQESMTTIHINNIDDASAKNVALADGVLTVDGKWEDFSNGIFTPGDYRTKIENLL